MSIYEIEVYDEKKFLKEYPVRNDVIDSIIKKYGIDKSKYYFSQALGFLENHLEVSYVCIEDEDTSLTIEIVNRDSSLDLEKIRLEND